jgi:hypothetical protein
MLNEERTCDMGKRSFLTIKYCTTCVVALSVFCAAGQLSAKKTAKTVAVADRSVNAGRCQLPDGGTAPDISTQARLIYSENDWAMSIETVGANSAGMWFINFTKNDVGEPSTLESFNPPGGWSVVGSHIDKSAAKGKYIFSAKATKYTTPIIVCEVTISTNTLTK